MAVLWLFCGCSAGLRGLLFVAGWGVAMDSDDDLTVPAPLQRGRGPASIVDASTIVKPTLEACLPVCLAAFVSGSLLLIAD